MRPHCADGLGKIAEREIMRIKLTDRFCATVKAEAQTDYMNETVPGLRLRVTPME
jgi:hypothetical protein